MKAAIITVAGISSRFNEGIPEQNKELKAIYPKEDREATLLHHLLEKCSFADRIAVVGGYKFDELKAYCEELEPEYRNKITLVENTHYSDLASGYSLYLGLAEVLREDVSEVLFIEGDLDVDDASFHAVVSAEKSVLTYTFEPIYANKAVVLYQNADGEYRYAFNSSHGLLSIDEPFSCILNSGQTWKFTDAGALRKANERFFAEDKGGTNLIIVRNYLELAPEVELVGLHRWTNCNTREDYRKIRKYWEDEK